MFRKKVLVAALLCVLAVSATFAQIRNYVAVVRPVYHQKTVEFLQSLSAGMKADGYDEAADMIKSYAAGGYGSGFVIVGADGSNYVVTNRHVISQAESVTLEFEKEDDTRTVYTNCAVLAVDETLDLALVSFPKGARPFKAGLAFSRDRIEDGQEVWTAGFPGLLSAPTWQLGKGNITNGRAKVPELADPAVTPLIQHSAQVDPGNSGGPLLVADKTSPGGYRVVGINTWKVYGRQAANFSYPAPVLIAFIEGRKAEMTESPAAATRASLEDRCRALISALSAPEQPYKQSTRFISYEYVARDGQEILKDVLSTAPSEVRRDILGVFSGVSPIEGIRMAIAYAITTRLSQGGNPPALSFVSVDGAVDTPAGTPVRFSASGKDMSSTWVREHGVWRLTSFPLKDTVTGEKKSEAPVTVSFRTPYLLLFSARAAYCIDTYAGFQWSAQADIKVADWMTAGLEVAARPLLYTDPYISTSINTTLYTFALTGRLQLPVRMASLTVIPYLSVTAGMQISNEAYSLSGMAGAYGAGVHLGFGSRPQWFVGLEYRSLSAMLSMYASSQLSLYAAFGM